MHRLSPIVPFLLAASVATAAPLTADEAVRIALQHNTQIVQSTANVLTAQGSMWSAYSGVLPRVSASASHSGSILDRVKGFADGMKDTTVTLLGQPTVVSIASGYHVPTSYKGAETYTSSRGLTGSWDVLDFSAWSSLSSARSGMSAARYQQAATRADVVLATRRQFYQVVQSMHQSRVNTQALRLARDSERRIQAMFEVGSVSKSDLLNARVNTAQAELDSLSAAQSVLTQRITLAQQMGVPERDLPEVDSTLVATPGIVDSAAVLAEARGSRPDLRAADAEARSAELGLRAARWSRLPYLTANGSWTPESRRQSVGDTLATVSTGSWSGSLALNLNLFDGFATDGRVASARARVISSRETRDALLRNLESEVHQALLSYQAAVQSDALASRSVEAATENENLVQQKYNVGSATILDLINAQVQLQRAQSNQVAARAAIQVAQAQLDRVRGRSR